MAMRPSSTGKRDTKNLISDACVVCASARTPRKSEPQSEHRPAFWPAYLVQVITPTRTTFASRLNEMVIMSHHFRAVLFLLVQHRIDATKKLNSAIEGRDPREKLGRKMLIEGCE